MSRTRQSASRHSKHHSNKRASRKQKSKRSSSTKEDIIPDEHRHHHRITVTSGKKSMEPSGKHSMDRRTKSPSRSALSPLNPTSASGNKTPRSTARSERTNRTSASTKVSTGQVSSYNAYSDNPFFGEESEFEMMHIKVTLLSCHGILVSRKFGSEPDSFSASRGRSYASNPYSSDSGYSYSHTSSSITSVEDDSHLQNDMDMRHIDRGQPPLYAVVTFTRNVTSSATAISSHLPSMPVANRHMSPHAESQRLTAVWPAQQASHLLGSDDESSLVEQSSFVMQRVMMREQFENIRRSGSTNISNYVNETVDLTISVKLGNEMIPLGVSSLVISGDEEGPTKMKLPVKAVQMKGKKMVVGDEVHRNKLSGLFKKKKRDKASFPSEKGKEYFLEGNANLTIALQVIPHSTFQQAEADKVRNTAKEKKRAEQDKRRRSRRSSKEKCGGNVIRQALGLLPSSPAPAAQDQPSVNKQTCEPGEFNLGKEGVTQLLCGSNLCNNLDQSGQAEKRRSKHDEKSVDEDVPEDQEYLRYHGVSFESSVLSSVSESESESDEDDYDKEVLIHRSIAIRKRI